MQRAPDVTIASDSSVPFRWRSAAVLLLVAAIALFTIVYFQVDSDVSMFRSMNFVDVMTVITISFTAAVIGSIVVCLLRKHWRGIFAIIGVAGGSIIGILTSQCFFPGNRYLANQIHFACITLPVTGLFAAFGAFTILWAMRRLH